MNFLESLNIENNVFELLDDATIGYLVQFAAPFTGGDNIIVPKGTKFAPHGLMRNDALYMHIIDKDDKLLTSMEEKVKGKYEGLYSRLSGFSFYITEEQIHNLPLKFVSGSKDELIEQMVLLRDPKNYK